MTTMTQPAPIHEPQRARAVFSTEDFELMRTALAHYLQQNEAKADPDVEKYGRLYHRLRRIG